MKQDNENEVHRVLVLQGGGALGAYEAGVFDVLYYWIKKDDDAANNDKKKNVFDVVAGTSVGAINAAIIISHVKENSGRWEGCPQKLLDFWEYVSSSPDLISYWPFWPNWPFPWDEKSWMKRWDQRGKVDHDIATGEAARRYYSAKEFLSKGAPGFFSKPRRINDDRFLDDLLPFAGNVWYRYSNKPLRESIEKYITKFPIATDQGQPRLLLVTVDVMTGATVTFDSYSKPKDGKGDREEGDERRYEYKNPDDPDYDFEINYRKGIMPEHILASASVPVNFDYAGVPTNYDYSSSSFSTIRNYSNVACDKKIRCFWDGGLLSNSPLREVISEHKLFWEAERNVKSKDIKNDTWKEFSKGNKFDIPNLQVYIVDLWPSKEREIPNDHDKVVDRRYDITYQNKTDYDQKVALIVTDYIDLVEKIGDLALDAIGSANSENKKNELRNKFDRLLTEENAKSKQRNGKPRKYQDLIKGRFDLETAFHLERKDDPETISNKWFDFSASTITTLIEDGRREALERLKDKEEKGKKLSHQLKLFVDAVERSRKNGEINQSHADSLIILAKSIDK
jgi:predicted acylesterase/phospholipase RssA